VASGIATQKNIAEKTRRRAIAAFIVLRHCRAADEAVTSVHANNAAAFRAGPSCFFTPDKLADAILFDVSKIFNHAHSVFCSVSLIQRLHSRAGIFFALEAELPVVFVQFITVLDYAAYTTWRFVFIAFPATGAFVFFP